MQQISVTPLYAAILGLLFLVLSIRVIAARRASGVAIGVGGQAELERRARVHANFAEYVPLSLILMLMVEVVGYSLWMSHTLGAALVVGRVVHAFGVSQQEENFIFRVTGMAITLTIIGTAAFLLIISYV
jgi:uncharacterized membrane protein YecN with MAPEG domain